MKNLELNNLGPIDLIGVVFYKVKTLRKEFMKDFLITWPQFELLQVIDRNKSLRINQVKDFVFETERDSSRMIKRLEELDFLSCEVDVEDKRSTRVSLTMEGEEILGDILTCLPALNKAIGNALNKEQHDNLNEILLIICDGFKN